ncbi:MAG TPA: GntR family transcriptional regulator [Casimicrobiaceae bacterium]|nr:GntR family transcriptional regulator [Casimicrobiaceae bacterium]
MTRSEASAAEDRERATDPAATVGEIAYRRIRTDIVFGRLAPGQKLTLEPMREAYSASVSTLREILNRLSSEGLIVAEGARGFEVMPVSADNLRQVASMRQLLECHALKESFEAGDMEWEGRVVAAHHKLASIEKRMASGQRADAHTWKRYDGEFHHALISACGSRVLLDTHATIYDRYIRYQMLAAVYRGEAASSEHRTLLDCALARDWRAAQRTLTTHVQDCVEQMLVGGKIG